MSGKVALLQPFVADLAATHVLGVELARLDVHLAAVALAVGAVVAPQHVLTK